MSTRRKHDDRLFWVASLGLFFALLLVRLQVVDELDIDLARAFTLGLGVGLAYDAILAVVPLLVAGLLYSAIALPRWLTWSVLAFTAWGANAAHVTYFRYFGGRLDAWAIQHHAADLLEVRGAAASLALTPWLLVGVGVFAALALVAVRSRRRADGTRGGPAPPRHSQQSRDNRHAVFWGVVAQGLVACWGLLWLSTAHPRIGTVLDDQIVFIWAKTGFGTRRLTPADHRLRKEVDWLISSDSETLRASMAAAHTLARYRDWATEPGAAAGVLDPRFPLLRQLPVEPDETRRVRAELGLPEDRAPNVIVLFLESVRALELEHPEIGPHVFPKLRALLREHAWSYRQAYSSAVGAGQTVRGQFSTLCSQLPNLRGPATYLAHYSVEARCLAELARENGYQTYWISSQDEGFNHKQLFESLHGTDHFYGQDFFAGLGLQKNFDNCGVADGPFLLSYLELLERLGEQDAPFFVNTLTITTHVPHTLLPNVELPEALAQRARDRDALGYLQRLRYLDEALDGFFSAFFESEIADDTLVVLLGDHALNVDAAVDLEPHQRMEMLGRIPLAIVTRDIANPRSLEVPVHQVDVAPTVARIAGLVGVASWLGRPLGNSAGTPWVMELSGTGVQYRIGDRACYETPATGARHCYDVSELDPLLSAVLPEIAEQDAETRFFDQVIGAQGRAILLDQIAPQMRQSDATRQVGKPLPSEESLL